MNGGAYDDPAERSRALHLGMWIFLCSETLLFAGLFGLYSAYRSAGGDAFLAAAHHNVRWVGSVNTLVLVVSSFFVALAVHLMRRDRPRAARRCLYLVVLLGMTFLGLKVYEYSDHLAHGLGPRAHIFFMLYYMMTGLHAVHVIAGLAIMLWLIVALGRGRFDAEYHLPVELGGLYWHLVDVVWIFLWPLLYLT